MTSIFKVDVSIDAVATEQNYTRNAVSKADIDETTPKCIVSENTSSEETERTLLTDFLEHGDTPNSFAEYLIQSRAYGEPMNTSVVDDGYPSPEIPIPGEFLIQSRAYGEPMDISVVDNDDTIHRFLLELTATHDLKWTTFLADLGYSSKDLLRVPQEKKDDNFFRYLELWLKTFTSLGQNPVQYLYGALVKSHHKALIDELMLHFPRATQGSPSDNEFAEVKNILQAIISKQKREATCIDIEEEIMCVKKEIWSNITDSELEEIKAYLHNKEREKFGKKVLEKIKTCIDLMKKLKETCLVQNDDFDFLKKILKFVNRDDLINRIIDLEARIRLKKDHDLLAEKQRPIVVLPTKLKLTQMKNLVNIFSSSIRIIEQNISAQTQDLQKTDENSRELTNKSEACRQKMAECAKQKMQIEIQIRKLRSEMDVLQCSEKTFGSECISIHKEKEELNDLHKKQATELDRFRKTLKKENELLVKHKNELEIMEADLKPVPVVSNQEPVGKPAILVMTAEENTKDLESFKCDVIQAVAQSNILDVIIKNNTTEEFLSGTDKQIKTAKLIFILVSDVFVKRCWPDVSKMKNLTSALVDKQPLVVPVNIVGSIKFPMGLKSAHCLAFHRHDCYYKEALAKVLRQFLE
ncbi:uncharacterized protein LOC127736629 [Mytilus californianus]|uniref:uncharacterized protein LOC127736629 n=1 Tax=Mytilus californianus TaxID=6549 RepID=UPI0022476E79|nr:uncharacterized protein LOC127736629 [Mytilus californianus]